MSGRAPQHDDPRRDGRAASGLVVAEIALAVVLLAGAGLTLRSFANLLAVDPGFTPAGVLTVQFALPDGRYDADEARRAFYARAFADIEALPESRRRRGDGHAADRQQLDGAAAARRSPARRRPAAAGSRLADRPRAAISARCAFRCAAGRLFERARRHRAGRS